MFMEGIKMPITDYPEVVKRFLSRFEDLFSKPQFQHFAEYLTTLIVCMRFTISWMNNQVVGHRDRSTKTRFLTGSTWSEVKVNKRRIDLILSKVKGINPNRCYLAIDDVILHHSNDAKKIENIGKFYDYSTGQYVIGHVIVTCHYICPLGHFPIDLKLYLKKGDPSYLGKPELAKQLIKQAVELGLPFRTIVFDAWYLSKDLSNFIEGLGKSWVSACRSDRIVYIRGQRTKIIDYLNSIPKDEFKVTEIDDKRHIFYAKTLKMSKQGKVKVVVLKDSEEESGYKILLTHETTWKPEGIIRAYRNRWAIETFYRDAKQNLGLEGYMLRDITGIKRHWYLVFLAFTLLQLSSMDKGLRRLFKNNAVSIGSKCRQAVNDTIRSFIFFVLKQNSLNRDLDEIIKIVFSSRAQLGKQFSFAY